MKNKFLYIVLIISLIKGLVWMFIIPIFQSPDETVHFGYTQRLGEIGSRGNPRSDGIISKELIKTGEAVNFSMAIEHPVWRGYKDDWKQTISRINQKDRSDFTIGGWPLGKFNSEGEELNDYRGRKNPPLYYWLASGFYKTAGQLSFLTRFYFVRFFSVLLSLAVVYLAYLTGKIIFKEEKMALVLSLLVAFQPMFSFISAVCNNDNLIILLVSAFVYFGVKAINSKKQKYLVYSLIVILLGIITKPQALILLIPWLMLACKKKTIKIVIFFALPAILLLIIACYFSGTILNNIYILRYSLPLSEYSEFVSVFKNTDSKNLISTIRSYFSASRETYLNNLFPWYWGVFGWLESTMPIFVYRILKVICLFSLAGLVVYFKKIFHQKEKRKILFFLFLTSLFFSAGIIFNDFKVYSKTGEAFGLQGRYFLPLLIANMAMIILGLKALVPKKFIPAFPWVLISGSFILNIIGFITAYSYFWGSL